MRRDISDDRIRQKIVSLALELRPGPHEQKGWLNSMKKTIFRGAGVAIVTPMHADGTVNFDVLGELIDFQISSGTDAIVVCGTTGESATLNHEEHTSVIKYAVKKTAGRVPVIAGTGSNDTAYAAALSKEAEKDGADALLMVTPYYNKATQNGLVRHYFYVADRVNVPIIVYNVPSRTGLDIKPETYKELSRHANIVAAKEANGDISAAIKTASLCGDDLPVYCGSDDQIVPFLSIGAFGVISVLSNILPKQTHDLCQLFFDGRPRDSLALQLKLTPLISALFSEVNPIPVKRALNKMGVDAGECRLPLSPMDPAKEKLLIAEMANWDLLP